MRCDRPAWGSGCHVPSVMRCISSGTVTPKKPSVLSRSCQGVFSSNKTMQKLPSLRLALAVPALLWCLRGRGKPKMALLRPTGDISRGGGAVLGPNSSATVQMLELRQQCFTAVSLPGLERHTKLSLCLSSPWKGFALQVPAPLENVRALCSHNSCQLQVPYVTNAPWASEYE